MPTTTNWEIVYPNNTTAPNVPADLQAQAESVEAAFNAVALAPLAITSRSVGTTQAAAAANTFFDVKWNGLVHKQGITHTNGDSTFIVPSAGIYQINTRVAFTAAAGQTAGIQLNVNGIDLSYTLDDETGTAGAWAKPRISQAIKLNAGDAVKVRGRASVSGLAIFEQSDFQIVKIAGF
jgi:hypothetical protein